YYFTQVLPSRCRLDDNNAAELVTGTFYKLALVWDIDTKLQPGRDDLAPEEEVIVATQSGVGLDGFTPSDLECFDFDGDGADEVFVGTRSSIRGSDGQPGHVFMLDPPFTDLHTGWDRRITVTEGPFAGRELVALGDIDGDGLGVLCISVSGSSFGGFEPRPSEVRLVLSSQGLEPASRIVGQDGDSLECLDGTGDVDGDGLVDFLIYGPGRDSLWLVTGANLSSSVK